MLFFKKMSLYYESSTNTFGMPDIAGSNSDDAHPSVSNNIYLCTDLSVSDVDTKMKVGRFETNLDESDGAFINGDATNSNLQLLGSSRQMDGICLTTAMGGLDITLQYGNITGGTAGQLTTTAANGVTAVGINGKFNDIGICAKYENHRDGKEKTQVKGSYNFADKYDICVAYSQAKTSAGVKSEGQGVSVCAALTDNMKVHFAAIDQNSGNTEMDFQIVHSDNCGKWVLNYDDNDKDLSLFYSFEGSITGAAKE